MQRRASQGESEEGRVMEAMSAEKFLALSVLEFADVARLSEFSRCGTQLGAAS
jgi:hypothetical protein